jgi:hypothetical protein
MEEEMSNRKGKKPSKKRGKRERTEIRKIGPQNGTEVKRNEGNPRMQKHPKDSGN